MIQHQLYNLRQQIEEMILVVDLRQQIEETYGSLGFFSPLCCLIFLEGGANPILLEHFSHHHQIS